MRKISLIAAAALFAAPLVSEAASLNELLADKGSTTGKGPGSDIRAYYNKGTILDAGDAFDTKLNLLVKPTYTYADIDGGPDTNDFEVAQGRLELGGNLMQKQFSYLLQNDFATGTQGDGSKGSELKDAWMQWNADELIRARAGQFKVPFGRQALGDDPYLQFIDRSAVNNYFTAGRNQGVMLTSNSGLGAVDECYGYQMALVNGESDGEGINRAAVDNNLLGALSVYWNYNAYDRNVEGDPMNSQDFQMTMGASGLYGQGSTSYVQDIASDFDQWGAGVDMGLRYAGWSLQSEVLYRNADLDDVDVTADEYGVYVQGGYFFVPQEWELAARFGHLELDKDVNAAEDEQEYAVLIGYYLNGHNLKIQTGVSWLDTNYEDTDTTDFRYQVGVTGYF